jgi:hypothetical protein
VLPPWLHAQPRRLVTALPTTNFANHYSYRWLCIGPSATESSKAAPKGAQTRIYREPTTKNPIRVYSARAKHAFSERTAGAGRAGARRRMSRHQRARCRQTRKPKRVPPPRATSLPRSRHHAWEIARTIFPPPHSSRDSPEGLSLRSPGSRLRSGLTLQYLPQRCHRVIQPCIYINFPKKCS